MLHPRHALLACELQLQSKAACLVEEHSTLFTRGGRHAGLHLGSVVLLQRRGRAVGRGGNLTRDGYATCLGAPVEHYADISGIDAIFCKVW